MAGGRSRSLGERLSTSALLILFGALAGVVGLVVFVTGKNLPDLLGKAPAPVPTASSPGLGPTQRTTPATGRSSASSTTHAPSPTYTSQVKSPLPNPPASAKAVRPIAPVLLAPSLNEIKACIRQLGLRGMSLADDGLNDSNLGRPATLHIKVGLGDYTYRLIAADSSCHPTTLVTVSPGQSATVHIYFGAMWDFDYPGESWVPEDDSPTGPLFLGPFIFSKPTTVITTTTP
jgi:hypothetical protein